jgi:hypothetical protein
LHRVQWAVFALLSPLAIRVRVPVAEVQPSADLPVEALVVRWNAVREQLAAHLAGISNTQLPLIVFKHPVGGPVPIVETLQFIRLHLVHHRHQIRRIRSARGWPASPAAASRAALTA